VSLPLLDGGQREAHTQAAQAREAEAESVYRAKLRTAVREVEDALVSLAASAARQGDAQTSADGFDAVLRATDARQRSGLASLFELEAARRDAVQSRSALIELQRERVASWIALYRALGGGWVPDGASAVAER
jgi:multidrug efflux system outer membrane protein